LPRYAREALLPTLRKAFVHSFYRDFWKEYEFSESNIADAFADLPSLKKELMANLLPELDDGDSISTVTHSSGSSGKLSFRFRSVREIDLSTRHFSEGPTGQQQKSKQCISLVFPSFYHGTSRLNIESPGVVKIACSLTQDVFADHFLKLITGSVQIPGFEEGVSSVVGPLKDIQAAAILLKKSSASVGGLYLGSYGGYLTKKWRKEIEEAFGSGLFHSYSVSEVGGGAIVCPKCGHLTFPPQILPHVNVVLRGRYAGRPIGTLSLTELLPFGLCQPVVKFETGDIVALVESSSTCCPAHIGGIKMLGRVATSLWSEKEPGKLVVSSNDIKEIFDSSFVQVGSSFRDLAAPRLDERLGSPIASLELGEGPLDINLIARFKPNGDTETAQRQIRERCLAIVQSANPNASIAVQVVPDVAMSKTLPK